MESLFKLKGSHIGFLSLVCLVLAACVPQPSSVNITSPTEGEILINEPLQIEMSYGGTQTVAVTLNGRNISQFVSFQSGAGTADGDDIAYAIKQGQNVLAVKEPGKAAVERRFQFDNAGPKVQFDTIVRSGGTLQVSGKVIDPSAVASVMINDTAVSLDSNKAFKNVSIAQADSYGVLAEDVHGIKSYDHYLASGAPLDPMIRSSVRASLIDDLSPIIGLAMGVPKDREVFDAINPIVGPIDLLGQQLAVDLTAFQTQVDGSGNTLGTATVNSLIVSPESSSSTVTADITLTKPLIGVEIMLGTIPVKVLIRAENMDINGAKIRLATNDEQELVVEFSEDLPIDLTGTTIEIVDSGPIIGFFLGNPLSQFITGIVTDFIEPALAQVLPGLINAELATRLEDLFLGLNINDENALFKIGIGSFGKDGDKVLADLVGQYQNKNPIADDYALGIKTRSTIDQDTGEISIGGDLPVPADKGQLNATVSFDLINQAMLFAFESGLLDLNLVGENIVIGEENVAAAASEGDLWIQVKPSVPELQLFGGEGQANVDVNLQAFEFNVRMRSGSGFNDLMNLKVSVQLAASFGFDPDSKAIFLETSDVAPMIDVMEIKTLGIGIPPGLANLVVGTTVPVVADLLMEFFKIELPIPEELPVQLKDISTVGDKGQHLSVSMDIDLMGIINLVLNPPAEE